jgi:osmotically-inducible protein OsmY
MGYPKHLMSVSAILLALLAMTACSTLPPRTSAERATDAELAATVQAALRADPVIYSPHIDVEVERGEVHLKGFVYSDGDRKQAQADAEAVPGVQIVDMEMGIMGGGISQSSN